MKKTYTFTTNKKNNRINTPSIESNNSAYINAIMRDNLNKIFPYLGTIDEDYKPVRTISTARPKKTVIDITISKPKKNKSTFVDFNDYTAFRKAVDYLNASYDGFDTYDFMIGNIPVKIFNDGEIQIGYDLFNLNNIGEIEFSNLAPKTKKTIIDIYISLNK